MTAPKIEIVTFSCEAEELAMNYLDDLSFDLILKLMSNLVTLIINTLLQELSEALIKFHYHSLTYALDFLAYCLHQVPSI